MEKGRSPDRSLFSEEGPGRYPVFEQTEEIVSFFMVMQGLSHPAENPLRSPREWRSGGKGTHWAEARLLQTQSVLIRAGPQIRGSCPCLFGEGGPVGHGVGGWHKAGSPHACEAGSPQGLSEH